MEQNIYLFHSFTIGFIMSNRSVKVFNFIYDQLMDHGFIKKGVDEKKQRDEALSFCIPMLEEIAQFDDKNISEYISNLLLKLNIRIDDKENLGKIFTEITSAIEKHEEKLQTQSEKLDLLMK